MKGQKLFVRVVEAADAETICAFSAQHGGRSEIRSGLVGKLVGGLAAVLAMELQDDAIRILDLVVAEELRRKRVGRVMLNELAALAARMQRSWLVADVAHAAFLQRVGFIQADGVMKRRVG